jgi:hypothetical protein
VLIALLLQGFAMPKSDPLDHRVDTEGVDLDSDVAIFDATGRVDWTAFDFGNVTGSAGEQPLIDSGGTAQYYPVTRYNVSCGEGHDTGCR